MVLPDRYLGKGNAKAQQSSMKLSEIGPRITMELYKVEKGLAEGDVLYHKFEQKTAAEAAALKAKVCLEGILFALINIFTNLSSNSIPRPRRSAC